MFMMIECEVRSAPLSLAKQETTKNHLFRRSPIPAQFVRFVILMAQAVPISLYVTLETVKVAQCKVGGRRRRL
jgi:hypothetical protein